MYSATGYWVNGVNKFFVSHESEKGIMNLDEQGSFPTEYQEIRGRLLNEQQNEENRLNAAKDSEENSFPIDCVFDIPVELAAFLTGFRHDRYSDDDEPFEILVPNRHQY